MASKEVDTAMIALIGPLFQTGGGESPATGIVFNEAGMNVDIIKETQAGTTVVSITPTASGDNAWAVVDENFYSLQLTAAQNDTQGTLTVKMEATGVIQSTNVYTIIDPTVASDLSTFLGTLDASTKQIATTTFVAGAINAAAIATDAIGSDELATTAVNEIRDAILSDSTAFQGADIAAILTDTAEIGAAGAGLTAINLPNQTMDITGDITGNLSGSVGSVTGNVGGNVTGSVGSNLELGPAEVNAEVVDVMKTDTLTATPQGAPSTTPTFEQGLMVLYDALVHAVDVTATSKTFKNNGGTVIWKKALSDDGTTYTEAESASGP